jgi:acetate---CoA ligase (ADP-forming)
VQTAAAKSSRRELGSLFEPRSIAIVGASANPIKWGHMMARDALLGAERRRVYLVNAKGGGILGQTAYRAASELPEPPELVVLTVPERRFEEAVADALGAGARALVAITAGLAEGGEEGRARERAVVARVREAGAVMLGPNCGGVADTGAELDLGLGAPTKGPIGLISQSGNVALELARMAADIGLGFTRVASIGNQADLEVADLVADLATHEPTRVIALYVEDFRHGRALAEAILEAGKPVIVLAAGASEAGARAATSHTGALVSDLAVVDAACREAGAVRVNSLAEVVHVAKVLLHGHRAAGPRVAVVTDGGGHGVIAADLAIGAGLVLPTLSEKLQRRIRDRLPGRPVAENPLDLAGAGDEDLHSYERVIEELGQSKEVDSVILTGYFGGYSVEAGEGAGAEERESEVALRMAAAAGRNGIPLLTQTMHWDSSPAIALRDSGVPIFARIDDAITALGRVVGTPAAEPGGIASLPSPEPEIAGDGYWVAREALSAAGVPLTTSRRVGSREEALAAAAEIGYPVALKATDILHKSDLGGVALGLADEEAVSRAFDSMAHLESRSHAVEPMAPLSEGVELLLGSRHDPRFGPVVAVGLGGLYTELLDDFAVGLAPIDAAEAERMLRSLRGVPLLLGSRGRPPLDLAAAAGAAAALSNLAAAHPEIAAVEVNPLLVLERGVIGLDARIVRAEPATP